ncbi:hypothetical protein [Paraburkholderia terrae]|uniref:Uncharacterized protein n=1 Tax=Paraburkholderia terrae TaxID=311230 RepID=A0A2I8EKW7_9BURK|nr:hypothetical protein [Paraburkholderia terrae]AUT60247.1 hypothetical protein C2L65_12005 [Paraburkholderia terrae]
MHVDRSRANGILTGNTARPNVILSMPMIFDDESRAEMLCYFVVGELVAMARTGDWLKTDHLVELSRIWLHANGAQFEWQERISIARIAAEFAPDVLATIELRTEKTLASLFTDGWRLDYRVPVVCEIHDRCAARLRRM